MTQGLPLNSAERSRPAPIAAFAPSFEQLTGLPLDWIPASHPDWRWRSAACNPFCLQVSLHGACPASRGVVDQLSAARRPCTLVCTAGLVESVVPVAIGPVHAGWLRTGQVVLSDSKVRTSNPDWSRWNALLRQTRTMPRSRYESALGLVDAFARALANHSEIESRTPPAAGLAERARRIVEAQITQPLSLRTVARALNASPSHLSRTFRHVTGRSLTQYIATSRVNRAQQLLQHTDHSVAHIALESGFTSLSQFNRIFVRETGCAPRTFRNRLRP